MVKELSPQGLGEFLKDLLPRARRFGRMYQALADETAHGEFLHDEGAAAKSIGISPHYFPVSSLQEIEAAFASAARDRIDAMNVKADSVLVVNRSGIGKLTRERRVPTICADRRFAETGALVSYGEDFVSRYRRASLYCRQDPARHQTDRYTGRAAHDFRSCNQPRDCEASGCQRT